MREVQRKLDRANDEIKELQNTIKDLQATIEEMKKEAERKPVAVEEPKTSLPF